MMSSQQWMIDADVVLGGTHLSIEEALLDPRAWREVGKKRGWEPAPKKNHWLFCEECRRPWYGDWHTHMVKFIDHIADGKTIDDALASL